MTWGMKPSIAETKSCRFDQVISFPVSDVVVIALRCGVAMLPLRLHQWSSATASQRWSATVVKLSRGLRRRLYGMPPLPTVVEPG